MKRKQMKAIQQKERGRGKRKTGIKKLKEEEQYKRIKDRQDEYMRRKRK